MRVYVVDDHEVVRRGLHALLESDPRLRVVGSCGSAAEAVPGVEQTAPDVIVLDCRLPDGNGIDLCRELLARHPQVRALILTSYDDDASVLAAILAGASGYLLKEARGLDLVHAVRRVAAGQSMLDPVVTSRVLQRVRAAAGHESQPRQRLTDAEARLLDLIADGLTNREIAVQLGVAEKTVKNRATALFATLGVSRRAQAVLVGERLRRGERITPA